MPKIETKYYCICFLGKKQHHGKVYTGNLAPQEQMELIKKQNSISGFSNVSMPLLRELCNQIQVIVDKALPGSL